jgi:holo-[acyl-carrier protein] synthase
MGICYSRNEVHHDQGRKAMIYGIGTDLVEVERIEASITRFGNSFARRILTQEEFEEFNHSTIQARFLAKRFAAKEAFAKALGTGIRAPALFDHIGIGHDELGKPIFKLAPSLDDFLKSKNITVAHLSISDEKAFATAFVVLEVI